MRKNVRGEAAQPLNMLLELVYVCGGEARDFNSDRIRRVRILQGRHDSVLGEGAELSLGFDR
jgi:hypothetical protein